MDTAEKTIAKAIFIKVVIIGALVAIGVSQQGCMQVLGVKHLNAWGLEIDSTQGFDVSAGVMQYDGADNQKSMNLSNTKRGEKY